MLSGSCAITSDSDSDFISGTQMTMFVRFPEQAATCALSWTGYSPNSCKNLFLPVELENMTQRHTGNKSAS